MTPDDAPLKPFSPNAKVKADGSLLNPDYERVALRLAEGFSLHQAWEAIGKKAENNDQRKYRNKLLKQAAFKNRVKQIMDERETALAADAVYGEVMFMCNQLYREALAKDDIGRMQKAVEMRLQIAKDMAPQRGPPPAMPSTGPDALESDAPAEESRPVGRPPADAPQTKSTPSDIRKQLLEKHADIAPTPMAVE